MYSQPIKIDCRARKVGYNRCSSCNTPIDISKCPSCDLGLFRKCIKDGDIFICSNVETDTIEEMYKLVKELKYKIMDDKNDC